MPQQVNAMIIRHILPFQKKRARAMTTDILCNELDGAFARPGPDSYREGQGGCFKLRCGDLLRRDIHKIAPR